jgi:hypothetical protein
VVHFLPSSTNHTEILLEHAYERHRRSILCNRDDARTAFGQALATQLCEFLDYHAHEAKRGRLFERQ